MPTLRLNWSAGNAARNSHPWCGVRSPRYSGLAVRAGARRDGVRAVLVRAAVVAGSSGSARRRAAGDARRRATGGEAMAEAVLAEALLLLRDPRVARSDDDVAPRTAGDDAHVIAWLEITQLGVCTVADHLRVAADVDRDVVLVNLLRGAFLQVDRRPVNRVERAGVAGDRVEAGAVLVRDDSRCVDGSTHEPGAAHEVGAAVATAECALELLRLLLGGFLLRVCRLLLRRRGRASGDPGQRADNGADGDHDRHSLQLWSPHSWQSFMNAVIPL